MSRRAMFAPIRPSPIIPSCIRCLLLVRSAQPTIAPKPPGRRSSRRFSSVRVIPRDSLGPRSRGFPAIDPPRSSRPPRLVEVDQAARRRVVAGDRRVAVELRQDLRRQLLAELDAPLIEAVDVPHDALHEDLVQGIVWNINSF